MATLSAEERELVEAGKIEVGFTPEMVRVALGEPDRRYREQTAEGRAEIWAYHEGRTSPRFSVGVGSVFGRGGGTSYGGGVSVGTGGRLRAEERMRVVFREGQVAAFEEAEN